MVPGNPNRLGGRTAREVDRTCRSAGADRVRPRIHEDRTGARGAPLRLEVGFRQERVDPERSAEAAAGELVQACGRDSGAGLLEGEV